MPDGSDCPYGSYGCVTDTKVNAHLTRGLQAPYCPVSSTNILIILSSCMSHVHDFIPGNQEVPPVKNIPWIHWVVYVHEKTEQTFGWDV